MARQTLCLQYLVTGELDGVTPAPELAAPRSTGDTNQIYKPAEAVERLGLIDPDFTPVGPPTGISNRMLTYIWITGAEPGDADARVAVVDPEDPANPIVQELVADLSGQTRFYRATGVFLPQGSALQIRGLRPAAGQQVKVRLYVDILDDALSTAAALQAICCASDDLSPIELEALTYDYRQTTQNSGNSFVPTGTSATAHALRVRQRSVLSTFFVWGVVAPGVGESVAIRLFRFTPTTLQQVTTTFVLTAANFVVSTKIDLSSLILPIAFDPDDVLACSFVHVGPQVLQPLLAGWTFRGAPLPAPVPAALLPMVWPPS